MVNIRGVEVLTSLVSLARAKSAWAGQTYALLRFAAAKCVMWQVLRSTQRPELAIRQTLKLPVPVSQKCPQRTPNPQISARSGHTSQSLPPVFNPFMGCRGLGTVLACLLGILLGLDS